MKIGILGCGNIGGGIATRLQKNEELFFFDHHPERLKAFKGRICSSLKELLANCELLFLCVKPHNFEETALALKPHLDPKRHLVVSVMASVDLESLRSHLGSCPLARIMPNVGLSFGHGITAIVEDSHLSSSHKALLKTLCSQFGSVHLLPEAHLLAFTALTSSGPAYLAVMMEAIVEAALAMGLPVAQGQKLTEELLTCTLQLVQEHHWDITSLKWKIASPQGITIKGLNKLEETGLRSALIQTILATR